jgi:drug/metabolite transporter (DMT)-like permease
VFKFRLRLLRGSAGRCATPESSREDSGVSPARVWLLLVVALCGVSASGPLMAATAAPALAIAFWRNGAAALVLAPHALTRHEVKLERDVILAGVFLAGHFATWVSALKLTSVAAAIALVSLQVVWVALGEAITGAKPSRAVVAGSALALGGVLVITGVDFQLSRDALKGDVLALLGGVFAAGYVIAGSRVRAHTTTVAYTFACYGICAVVIAGAALVSGTALVGFSARDWFLIAALTVSAQFLGHSIVNHLLAFVAPVVMSLVLLLEVPMASMLAAIFLAEALPWGTYVGLALILAGLGWVVVRRSSAPEPEIAG